VRNTIANEIIKKAQEDKNLYLIAGDAGLGVWDNYKIDFPKQYLNPGVNEQCDIGLAAGMALRGHKVIFYNIAPFVIMRPYEQVRNDICYQNLPVILVGTGSGITYAPAGMTHYAVEDIALAKTMPNLDIFSPADPIEAKKCFEYAYNSESPSYIRIPKAGEEQIHRDENIDITKPIIIHEGKDGILFVHSSIIDEVETIRAILKESGKEIAIATVPMITSSYHFEEILQHYDYIFTLEEHFVSGGFGSILNEYCNENNICKKINKFGLKNEYIHKIGNRDYLRKYYGIDGKSVALQILEELR
jgi:transketolase